ncbi:cytochrome C [Colwelliaceae bacterium 6471]
MKYLWSAIVVALLFMVTSCDSGVKSTRGFSLPQGDVELGKATFLKYQCLTCHVMEGVEQDDIVKHNNISVKLGGKTATVKTYAELVTSVINPSHKLITRYPIGMIQEDGKSKMRIYNDEMTVTELINIVEFLQSKYELVPYRRTSYQYYDMGQIN